METIFFSFNISRVYFYQLIAMPFHYISHIFFKDFLLFYDNIFLSRQRFHIRKKIFLSTSDIRKKMIKYFYKRLPPYTLRYKALADEVCFLFIYFFCVCVGMYFEFSIDDILIQSERKFYVFQHDKYICFINIWNLAMQFSFQSLKQ